ncbi:MAG: hypothetical protein ACUVTL_02860 [Thermoproteota archaeon]
MSGSDDKSQDGTNLILGHYDLVQEDSISVQYRSDSPSSNESIEDTKAKEPLKSDLEEQFNALRDGLETVSKAYRAIQDKYSSLQGQYEAILADRDKLKEQLGSLIIEYELLQKSKKASEEELDRMRSDIAELQILREEVGRLRSLQTENEQLRMECNEKKAKYEAVSIINNRLSADLEELRKAYSVAKQYIDRAKAIEEENRKLRMELGSSLYSREAESLRHELKQLQAIKIDLERDLLGCQRKIEELQNQNQEVMMINRELKERLNEKERETRNLEEKNMQLIKEVEDLSLEKQKLLKFETEYNKIKENYEALRAEYESLKKKFENMPKIII